MPIRVEPKIKKNDNQSVTPMHYLHYLHIRTENAKSAESALGVTPTLSLLIQVKTG